VSTRHTTFQEVMAGTVRLGGEERPMRLELAADLPEVLRPWGDTEGVLSGRVHVPDWADDPEATGRLRVAPIAAGRIRYRLDFTAEDGRTLHLDGWKSVGARHPLHSMTYLPATITDAGGEVVGEAELWFDARRDIPRFLAGFRFPRAAARKQRKTDDTNKARTAMFRPRWRGEPGRLEVWYTTLTDPATGTGVWIHHELVAPSDGGTPRAQGWATIFPPGERPVLGRYGPDEWTPSEGYSCKSAEVTPDTLRGQAGELSWDLTATGGGEPLFTFPRWAWKRELLPAAQIVPSPTAAYDGTVRCGDKVLELRGAPGGTARIYGHGNGDRWVWLHADLGGGDVCEVVAAVSTRKGFNRLPPLPFVRLRVGGVDWPDRDPLLSALRMRAKIGLPEWSVYGRSGDRKIRIDVTLPPKQTVAVDYDDPTGNGPVCHNSETADAVITLLRRTGSRWVLERRWRLDGTAHAEVGLR
jgi:hypothetical protein